MDSFNGIIYYLAKTLWESVCLKFSAQLSKYWENFKIQKKPKHFHHLKEETERKLSKPVRNYKVQTGKSLSEALLFAEHGENMLCTKMFWMSETISVHNMFSPGLRLEFSCIELAIQWTISRHIVGQLMQDGGFWKRVTCTIIDFWELL